MQQDIRYIGKMHPNLWVFNTEAVGNYTRTCGFSMPKQCTFDHEEPEEKWKVVLRKWKEKSSASQVKSEEWKEKSEKWRVKSEGWKVKGEKWRVKNSRRKRRLKGVNRFPFILRFLRELYYTAD